MIPIHQFRFVILCSGIALTSSCQTSPKSASTHDPRPVFAKAEKPKSLPEESLVNRSPVSERPVDEPQVETQTEAIQLTQGERDVPENIAPQTPSPQTISPQTLPEATELTPLDPTASVVDSPDGNAPVNGMSLETFETIALQNNPAIAQASSSAHKAKGFRNQVGRRPNPVVGYSGQQLADRNTDQHMAFVEQEFVTANKLKLNQSVHDQEIQSQLWEVEAQRQRVLTDVRTRFYQALAAQQRMEIASEFYKVAEEGVRVAEVRLKALEGAVPEVLQAEIQLNEVDLIHQRAAIEYQAAWREMVAIAGVPDMPQQRLVGSLQVGAPEQNWDAIYHSLVSQSPAVRGARSRVSRAIANMNRQEVQAIPNLQTALAAGFDRGTNHGMLNFEVGIPLPIYNTNSGNISAAQAEYCRAAHDVRRLELELKQKLASTSRQYDSAAISVNRFENQILPKARKTLELSEKAYAAGEFDFLQVLVARRTYFDSNLQYNVALRELAESKALIDGMLLDGGLNDTLDTTLDDGLRGQTLDGQ
ncbi:TolC family protein [Planctomicrobium sp. SH527]|uniref:TolC family protein n=1 Tax=Planctomicrobium sp. SH527 TaxID=3448123 RepID=UPI003F5B3D63